MTELSIEIAKGCVAAWCVVNAFTFVVSFVWTGLKIWGRG